MGMEQTWALALELVNPANSVAFQKKVSLLTKRVETKAAIWQHSQISTKISQI